MTTVLVVDDNAIDRKIAGKYVEEAGWSADFAANGSEAIEKIEQQEPDLVLTDLQMPEMDGLELVQQIKSRFPTVPVVLITAHGSEELAVTALQAGASSYVPKRNLKRDLGHTLKVVLDSVESRRERLQLFEFMTATQSHFTLGYDQAGPRALVSYCQDALRMMSLCDATETLQVGTALNEALRNAIDHGNLELPSALREADDGSYEALRQQRREEPLYRDRRIYVETFVSRTEAKYIIRDEGSGFDWKSLPDYSNSAHVAERVGRGLMLIHMLMDEVRFNNPGNEVTLVKRKRE